MPTTPMCSECGSTRASVQRDAELMEDAQGFPVDSPICCETIITGGAIANSQGMK